MVVDPVCGMQVDERSARFQIEHQGTRYYFCSASCKQAFARNPGKYVKTGQAGHPDTRG